MKPRHTHTRTRSRTRTSREPACRPKSATDPPRIRPLRRSTAILSSIRAHIARYNTHAAATPRARHRASPSRSDALARARGRRLRIDCPRGRHAAVVYELLRVVEFDAALAPLVGAVNAEGATALHAACASDAPPSAEIVRLLLEDLFGEAAEKKEVEEIATSMKEARATRSYASFELLASSIQFVPNINLLVPPLHSAVLAAPGGVDSLKNVGVAREVLRHAGLGLAANPSVDVQPLCVYVRGLLVTHLPPAEAASDAQGDGKGGGERCDSSPTPAGPARSHSQSLTRRA